LAINDSRSYRGIYIVNGLSGGKKVPLLPLRNDGKPVPKIVLAPNPAPEDYVAVAICDLRRLAYTKTRDMGPPNKPMKWFILDVAIGEKDKFIDLVYDIDACAENVFFFGGNLYQVWQNTTSAISWATPGGGQFGMEKDDIFVLKYVPEHRPCWDVVKDLVGYSVFIGRNHPVVLQPEDVPTVRANCVYWINEQSRNKPMVTWPLEPRRFILPPPKHWIPRTEQSAGTS
ncbi:hypothetical protein BAE44_0002461, partial [Dichanthelium oligosanthes]